jgi:hypothetical protein
MITKSRWIVIVFLFLYLNILNFANWPRGLFNALLVLAALYNLGIHLYIKKTRFFSTRLTLIFLCWTCWPAWDYIIQAASGPSSSSGDT